MADDFKKAYEPNNYEEDIYKKWEERGYFNPDNLDLDKNASNYSIVMPPPNVTGVLHAGHASALTTEDILIRYHRMKGDRTLWIPGTDHAGIATQAKVESILLKEENKNKHEIGRENFLEKVYRFAENSHDTIVNQCKKMGSSCDWSREAYTLDKIRNKAVNSVFTLMYKDNLIYKGERVVNWCPHCGSTLSDDEVEYKEQNAKLYTFKYSEDFPFFIATTRPETKLGDTAVAVNPKDERFAEYIGKTYEVDFIGIKLKLKIIADRSIDIDFGTGALGVTPAHSMTDWQMGKENDLDVVKVINKKGEINDGFGEFSGKSVLEARKMIVEKLENRGLLKEVEEMENNLSICYRCDTPIEPLPSKQWFIDVNKNIPKFNKTIKELCIEAVKTGVFGREKINIYPERFEKNYFHWLENLQDWCISRQIWFGHRIPIWYKGDEIFSGVEAPSEDGWEQDASTLDTWFSSGLWTFSTLVQNAEQIKIEDDRLQIDGEDFKNFHPTSVLETGYDILFFWVARMILMTTYSIHDIPFQDVYLQGLVLDEKGKKMSKSKGNSINPLEIIEQYGTDALRLSLIIGSTPGNDLKLNEKKIESMRNLVNKLWNISRFILTTYDGQGDFDQNDLTDADYWILQRMKKLIIKVSNGLEEYHFSMVGELLREFMYDDFADWYLEASKFENHNSKAFIFNLILRDLLKLLHPFTPFVTEVIWNKFNNSDIIIEKWPNVKAYDDILKENNDFELVKSLIFAIRNARAENRVDAGKKIKAVILANDSLDILQKNLELLKKMRTGIESIDFKEAEFKDENSIFVNYKNVQIYLLDAVDREKENERIQKELEKKEKLRDNIKKKLENKQFIENAPSDIVENEKKKLVEIENDINKLKR